MANTIRRVNRIFIPPRKPILSSVIALSIMGTSRPHTPREQVISPGTRALITMGALKPQVLKPPTPYSSKTVSILMFLGVFRLERSHKKDGNK